MNGHLAACEILIKLGVSIELSNLSEKTLLQYAIESQCQEVIFLFNTLEKRRTKYPLYMTQTSAWNNELNYSAFSSHVTPKAAEKNMNFKKQSTLMNSVITGTKKHENYDSKPAKRFRPAAESNKTVIFFYLLIYYFFYFLECSKNNTKYSNSNDKL